MKSLLSRRLKGEGTFVGMKGKMSFVDDSVGIEELMHRATTDSLSGLLNRATMERSIAQRLSSMEDDESCAVFIIDLDDFKRVNDILGHQAGDSALVMSARTISRLFRASDVAGRLGGDEFSVFICGKDVDRAFVEDKGQALCEALQLSLGENGIVGLTASVGICPERFVACGIADKKRIYHIRFEAGHTAAMGEIALLAGDNAVCDTPNGSRSLGQLPVAHSRRIYIEAREQHIRIGHNEREGSIGRYTRFLHHAIPLFGQIADIVAASAQHIGIIFTRHITFHVHSGENLCQIFRHTP